jgi:hypothetical protein
MTRTQIRFPDALYTAIRHVAASEERSFNATLVALVAQALEFHREQIPMQLLSQLGDRLQTD